VRVHRIATALLLCASTGVLAAGDPGAHLDYLLKCSGCHNSDGSGHPLKGIPDFRGQVGYFVLLPQGRAFLMQVAGLMNSGLPDERAAAVTNYIVETFAGPSMPPDFQPYTPDEAKRYRESRPADLAHRRQTLYQQITAAGHPLK
jgi:hypothetical protein